MLTTVNDSALYVYLKFVTSVDLKCSHYRENKVTMWGDVLIISQCVHILLGHHIGHPKNIDCGDGCLTLTTLRIIELYTLSGCIVQCVNNNSTKLFPPKNKKCGAFAGTSERPTTLEAAEGSSPYLLTGFLGDSPAQAVNTKAQKRPKPLTPVFTSKVTPEFKVYLDETKTQSFLKGPPHQSQCCTNKGKAGGRQRPPALRQDNGTRRFVPAISVVQCQLWLETDP